MSDYLTEEEQLARLKSWWDDNGTSTVVGLVLVIVGVVGWRWWGGYHDEQVARASDLYQEFLAAEGTARDMAASTLAAEAGDTAYHALALMHLAQDAAANGDYQAADEHLQAAILAAPGQEIADLARLRLARVQQQGDRSDAALQTLGSIRGEGFRSHVAELKGDIHLARGERLLAHESYTAALTDADDQNSRPVLKMKAADTADAATDEGIVPVVPVVPGDPAEPAEISVDEPAAPSGDDAEVDAPDA